MRFTLLAIPATLLLAACNNSAGEGESESAQDFAARVNGQSAPAKDDPAQRAMLDALPKAAANGRTAVTFATEYTSQPFGGGTSSLTINEDGSYRLVENGQALEGRYEWLPDGRRLRLKGVETRPIVVIADGAMYRQLNEDVPLDDLAPERMYALPGAE